MTPDNSFKTKTSSRFGTNDIRLEHGRFAASIYTAKSPFACPPKIPMRQSFHVATLLLLLAGCSSMPTSKPSPEARLDHVAISVADLDGSAAFYKSVFGFKELKNPFPGGGGVVWLDLGNGTALHIFGGRRSPVTDERERHLAVTVPDMSRVTNFLVSRGIAWQNFDGVSGQMQTRPDGVNQMFFRDPDGYWIEVNDALKKSPR